MATADHARRLDAFRRRLDAAGLDGYWLADAANVRYLSGFRGEDSTLLVTAARSVLITDSRYSGGGGARGGRGRGGQPPHGDGAGRRRRMQGPGHTPPRPDVRST